MHEKVQKYNLRETRRQIEIILNIYGFDIIFDEDYFLQSLIEKRFGYYIPVIIIGLALEV